MIINILDKLKELYPDLSINIWAKDDKGKLFINEEVALKFNPELMLKQFMVEEIKNEKETIINNNVKVFAEYIDKFLKKKERSKKNKQKNLTYGQILVAVQNTLSMSACARYLNVHPTTLKRYAKIYNIELKYNQKGYGTAKGHSTWFKKVPIQEILDGKHPDYTPDLLKKRLIREGYFEERCSICGFQERRTLDLAVPVLLDFIDGDSKNHKLENLRLLCYNHYFIMNLKKGSKAEKKMKNMLYEENFLDEK